MVSRHLSTVAMGNKAASTAVMGLRRRRGGGRERSHTNSLAVIDDGNPVALIEFNGVENADADGVDQGLVMKIGIVSVAATLTSHKIVRTHYWAPPRRIGSCSEVTSKEVQCSAILLLILSVLLFILSGTISPREIAR